MVDFAKQQMMHPRFELAFEQAMTAIDVNANRGAVIPIMGPTRVGKSDLIKSLDEAVGQPRRAIGECFKFRDFVVGAIGAQPNSVELYSAIGRAMLLRARSKWRLPQLKETIFDLVINRGTRVIVLDEANHCAEPGANFSVRAAADHFKEIVDKTGVTLILVGLPNFQRKIIDRNEQLRERCSNSIYLLPYNWLLDQDRSDFFGLVVAVTRYIETQGIEVDLDVQDISRRLYAISGGRFGLVMELLDVALKMTGEDRPLTKDVIAKAAHVSFQPPVGMPDPFTTKTLNDTALLIAYRSVMSAAGLPLNEGVSPVDLRARTLLGKAAA